MEYILGKAPRKINEKNQLSIPADIVDVIEERNKHKYAKRLYLMLDYAQGPECSVPYIKCFDQYAFEKTVKGIIDASELCRQEIDKQGRVLIPKNFVKEAKLGSLDRIVFVEASSGKEWGMTFGIYNLDNYHKIKAEDMIKPNKRKQKRKIRNRG